MTTAELTRIRESNEARTSAPAGMYDRDQAITSAQDDIDALLAEVKRLNDSVKEFWEDE